MVQADCQWRSLHRAAGWMVAGFRLLPNGICRQLRPCQKGGIPTVSIRYTKID